MLKNFNILIIGGDARTLEVTHRLCAENATVYLAGFERANIHHPNIYHIKLEKTDVSQMDAILLPVAGTSETGLAETSYSDTKLYVTKEMLTKTPEHCLICTGIAGNFLNRVAKQANRKLMQTFARNDVAVYNSIPTAEGVLMHVIQHTPVTVHGANVFVLGFGRVGMTIARTFHAVGANVTVIARKPNDIARITEMGIRAVHLSDLNHTIPEAEICINTIPRPVLNQDRLSAANRSVLIIDIASAPGGTDFHFAKKHGIKALHTLGLPGKTAPKTAGKIIADAFIRMIME